MYPYTNGQRAYGSCSCPNIYSIERDSIIHLSVLTQPLIKSYSYPDIHNNVPRNGLNMIVYIEPYSNANSIIDVKIHLPSSPKEIFLTVHPSKCMHDTDIVAMWHPIIQIAKTPIVHLYMHPDIHVAKCPLLTLS